ncbi:uncharacterized protein LOC135678117 [Musa acuminata AAA Group]|uniref:(wild Malaysian banana) hypothetical protein n=1 Tax=Musa acuminata subsp. malaccensis TaxID=214687 RepID=A0A804JR18_MUSAM|nr:PREDICTED: uncharacterized protein LOC103990913 [Musa acuminata subsp. malaccensis]CAG1855322.1 unnamed protein product [Musa acuminata subsp. malaccensis]
MEGFYADFMELMSKPAVVETLIDVLLCAVPIWVAVMIGLVIGWSWRPRWTGLLFLGLRSRFRFIWTAPPGLGARRLWLAFTALSAFSVCRRLWSSFKGKREGPSIAGETGSRAAALTSSTLVEGGGDILSNGVVVAEHDIISEKDLEHLLHLLDDKVGDAAWQNQMERTTPNMIYHAWRHEPEVGPIIYRSRTVFEDATPELVRDFFWDDDFRLKWDSMLAYYEILEEIPESGTMINHWIKKFPFFCSDREYIIGRRIWESGGTYYCVTKGVPYQSLPKNEKPRRVELYFSSWRIRAVESRKQDGQLSSCEVTLVHYEDMGIPKDVAKVGVRHGMWGAVKRLQSGMRAYQMMRKTEASLSRCALMARITTKIPIDGSITPLEAETSRASEAASGIVNSTQLHGLDWKWVVVGGVAVVCGLQAGLVGKALLVGAARRLAKK